MDDKIDGKVEAFSGRNCCEASAGRLRGLSRVESAAYIGVSPSLFDELVKDGRKIRLREIGINQRSATPGSQGGS